MISQLIIRVSMFHQPQVDVQNRTSGVDLVNYVPNGEWQLLEALLVRNVVVYPCCPQEPFPDVTITLVIRRKTLYYMYNVVMPCMMMSVLTLLVFCLPPDSGEKIALGVTVLLAFSVFMLAIAEKMPETSESIPLLGKFSRTIFSFLILADKQIEGGINVLVSDNSNKTSWMPSRWFAISIGSSKELRCISMSTTFLH